MKFKNNTIQIACDGGAATGKTTGAKLLAKKYGLLCKNLVQNQKQRIDYWEKKGNKTIK